MTPTAEENPRPWVQHPSFKCLHEKHQGKTLKKPLKSDRSRSFIALALSAARLDPLSSAHGKLAKPLFGGLQILAAGCRARLGQPGRRQKIVAGHRRTGRQTGQDRVRSGSGTGRPELSAGFGARTERLHRKACCRKRRQARAVRTGQLAVPGRQREDPARSLERGAVRRPRRLSRARPDDEVDVCSGALEMLNRPMKAQGLFEFYRQQTEKLKAEAAPKPIERTY